MQPQSQQGQPAPVVYFCQYCGYEFAGKPQLPTKCPRCRRPLQQFGEPIIALRKKKKPIFETHLDSAETLEAPKGRGAGVIGRLTTFLWRLRARRSA